LRSSLQIRLGLTTKKPVTVVYGSQAIHIVASHSCHGTRPISPIIVDAVIYALAKIQDLYQNGDMSFNPS